MAMINKAILVIDEDEGTSKVIVEALESEDYLVFTAPDGEIGITMAEKVKPALIFINPTMTEMSGLEVCKNIHDTESLKQVPIVTLSAFQGAMDPRYSSVYGIVGSLKKPFTPEELKEKTEQILSREPDEVKPVTGDDIGAVEHEEASAPQERVISGMQKELDEAIEEEKKKHIHFSPEEPEEKISDSEKLYASKRYIRRSRRTWGTLPVLFTIIIILGIAGIILYNLDLFPWSKTQKLVSKKPAELSRQQGMNIPPQQEQQPQQTVPQGKPESVPSVQPQPAPPAPVPSTAPAPAAPAPAPALTPKSPSAEKAVAEPKPKPSGKVVYSVQIGAFKEKQNAETLLKQYKDKGYDPFLETSELKERGTLHRVLIGKSERRKEATQLAETINGKENIKAIVVKGQE
jgi:DNA-binding response OmpR family regulator